MNEEYNDFIDIGMGEEMAPQIPENDSFDTEGALNEDIVEKFNLPKYVKGKSFAEASKLIDKKFQDRNDQASLETKEELLERLADAQEYLKVQHEEISKSLMNNSQEVPEMGEGMIPPGAEEFMGGNNMSGIPDMGQMGGPEQPFDPGMMMQPGDNLFEEGGLVFDKENIGKSIGGVLGAYNLASGLSDHSEIDQSGKSGRIGQIDSSKTITGAIGSGASTGGTIGSVFGPLGTAIGSGIGALAGGIGGVFSAIGKKKRATRANRNAAFIQSNELSREDNLFRWGGNGDERDPIQLTNELEPLGYSLDSFDLEPSTLSKRGIVSLSKPPSRKSIPYGDILRLSPIIGNVTNRIKKPTTERGPRMDRKYQRDYIDQNSLYNQLNSMNVDRRLSESSGGNQGALMANMTGSHLNRLRGQSQIAQQIARHNAQQNAMAQQFDAGIDQTNMRMDAMYQENKARDRAAYETAKQAQRNAIFDDIGNIGRELGDKQTIRNIFGYNEKGEYLGDKEAMKRYKEYKKYLKSKKKSKK